MVKKTKKSELKNSVKSGNFEDAHKKMESKLEMKKNTTKKVVVKRRKVDLKPSRASAVAIASQANRAKKQALIEKVANSDINQNKQNVASNAKIPLWAWIFFGCSLMFFCISFYQAVILRPQVEIKMAEDSVENSVSLGNLSEIDGEKLDVELSDDIEENNVVKKPDENQNIVSNPQTPEELIQSFFAYMSDWKFDESFELFDSSAQNDQKIRWYFGAFKMQPFFEWIEWKSIEPQNIQKTAGVYKWKNIYKFDISYILESTHEQYDETWEFVPSNYAWKWKISRIYCVSSKCWSHPIFWPEEFGLMR